MHHEPWPLQPAEATVGAPSLLEAAGFGDAAGKAPHLLFARTLLVCLWPLRKV